MFTTNSYPTLFDRMLEWSRQMDEALTARSLATASDSPARAQLWLPAIVIEADLPGVHQENVDIQFDRGTLTISGARGATLPSQDSSQLRVFSSERLSGNFSRSIRLPEHVDVEHIEAVFAQGVLSLKVPKSTGAIPRKIAIKATDGLAAFAK